MVEQWGGTQGTTSVYATSPPAFYQPAHEAPHIGHALHLCDMAEKGNVSLDQMKALVKNPKFICKKCGRAAAKAENLCDPEPL